MVRLFVSLSCQACVNFGRTDVGIDIVGKIVGLEINYVNDTPGLGSKVADPEFANSIIGSKVGDKVDTIAGSTVSSAAVVKGIDAAAAVYQSLK